MKESRALDISRKINRFDVYYISEAGPRIWKTIDPNWQGTIVDFLKLPNLDPLDKIDITLSGNFLDDFESRRILLFCLKKISNKLGSKFLIAKKIEKTLSLNIREKKELDERICALRIELEANFSTYRSMVEPESAALISILHMCLSYSPSIAARNAVFTLINHGTLTKEQCIKNVGSVFYLR